MTSEYINLRTIFKYKLWHVARGLRRYTHLQSANVTANVPMWKAGQGGDDDGPKEPGLDIRITSLLVSGFQYSIKLNITFKCQ